MIQLFEENLVAGDTAARALWDAIPERAPDWATARRGIAVIRECRAASARLIGTLPEKLQSSAAFELRQAEFWLGRVEEAVGQELYGCVIDALVQLRAMMFGPRELIAAGSVEAAERKYWIEAPSPE